MELTHSFKVPASIDATWHAFTDLEMVAGCFPGATLTGVEGDDFSGTCKIKLGPIALQYAGSGTFLERDGEAYRFVIEAKGKDRRGNGTAGATVTAVLTSEGSDTTNADVVTALEVTGKPAQFGRGVIQDVSDKILNQFVDCLEVKLAAGEAPPAEEAAPAGAAPEAAPAEAPEVAPIDAPEPGQAAPIDAPEAGQAAPSLAPAPAVPAPGGAAAAPQAATEETPGPSGSGRPQVSAPTKTQERAARKSQPQTARESQPQTEALDLGATVLPILLKRYWREMAITTLVLVVLWQWVRRRR